jgi:hypothetical protein
MPPAPASAWITHNVPVLGQSVAGALCAGAAELAEIVATPTRISLYGDGERCGYPEECRLCYNSPTLQGDILEELTMTKSILVSLAILTLSLLLPLWPRIGLIIATRFIPRR